MEAMWGLFPLAILAFISFSEKNKKLEKRIKALEKKLKGDNDMSKLLSELKGMRCILTSDSAAGFAGKRDVDCLLLDIDDEWIKIEYTTKKGETKTRIMRIEEVISVELSK